MPRVYTRKPKVKPRIVVARMLICESCGHANVIEDDEYVEKVDEA